MKIVVLQGEGAVNILQQKTAVAPVIEVRDRNNVPVAGVVVTFSINGSGATFGGATTLTVTTNTAGQATAAGFTPSAAGSLQINATAAFQGQTAAATITQTNVLTAAQAASAAGTAGGSAAGGAAGGISGTTLGILGGVAAGGAVVATKAGGGGNAGAPSVAPTAQTPTSSTSNYSGTFSGIYSHSGSEDGTPCASNDDLTATISITVVQSGNSVSGTLAASGTFAAPVEVRCGRNVVFMTKSTPFEFGGSITGTPANIQFSQDLSSKPHVAIGPTATITGSILFSGSLTAGGVSGTLSINSQTSFPTPSGGSFRGTSTGSYSLLLR